MFWRGVLGYLPANIVQGVVGFLTIIIFTRLLSPEDFGGFSAIELSADGARYTALSDRATLRWGSVHRDSQGRIRELTVAGTSQLRDTRGKEIDGACGQLVATEADEIAAGEVPVA